MYLHSLSLAVAQLLHFKKKKKRVLWFARCIIFVTDFILFFHIAWRISCRIIFVLLFSFYPKMSLGSVSTVAL